MYILLDRNGSGSGCVVLGWTGSPAWKAADFRGLFGLFVLLGFFNVYKSVPAMGAGSLHFANSLCLLFAFLLCVSPKLGSVA